MLMGGGGDPLIENEKIWFSWLLGFFVSKFQRFKNMKIIESLLEDIVPISTNLDFMSSGRY